MGAGAGSPFARAAIDVASAAAVTTQDKNHHQRNTNKKRPSARQNLKVASGSCRLPRHSLKRIAKEIDAGPDESKGRKNVSSRL